MMNNQHVYFFLNIFFRSLLLEDLLFLEGSAQPAGDRHTAEVQPRHFGYN